MGPLDHLVGEGNWPKIKANYFNLWSRSVTIFTGLRFLRRTIIFLLDIAAKVLSQGALYVPNNRALRERMTI
jgi:hypothetical protein